MSTYHTTKQKKEIGRLYGMGLGPGDPELLTLRAYHLLSKVLLKVKCNC